MTAATMTSTSPHGHSDGPAWIEVWFDANVTAQGSPAGTVAAVVSTTHSPSICQVVVRASGHHHQEHVAPWAEALTGDRQTFTLDTTPAQLAQRSQPMKTVFVSEDPVAVMEMESHTGWHFDERAKVFEMPVRVPDLEPGEVLADNHTRVYVGANHIGRLAGCRAHLTTGQIAALIVDVGHVWHHHRILLPADRLTHIDDAAVWIAER